MNRPVSDVGARPKFHDGFGWAKVRQRARDAGADLAGPVLLLAAWPNRTIA
ncbi:hypothetical protein HMPREF0591_5769 [Mycobacterium parascrofulaceum ATCC BAA-614]|uniref:Uncharacterized protein n=1 Tax=Mycobacterium parascrofulaceum ATCC BAA-614 TaxID=525368 RepID=D5PHX5_9MYCO|nr:hypothetical protein HMPREF0591_5769 [Mycobacterium parascrofulaceum ATCC BAA-614]